MKKNIAILALALGCLALPLASCGVPAASSQTSESSAAAASSNAASSPTSSSAESSSPIAPSSSADPLMDAAEGAAKMLNYDSQAGGGLHSRTFSLATEIDYSDAYTFEAKYSIVQQTPYDGAGAAIYLDDDPGNLYGPVCLCIVTAPKKDPSNPAPWVVFVLTARISEEGSAAQELLSEGFNVRADPIA